MSIINQALKKAQREQLLLSERRGLQFPSLGALSPQRRRWGGGHVGWAVLGLGVGTALYAWLVAPVGQSPGVTETPSTLSVTASRQVVPASEDSAPAAQELPQVTAMAEVGSPSATDEAVIVLPRAATALPSAPTAVETSQVSRPTTPPQMPPIARSPLVRAEPSLPPAGLTGAPQDSVSGVPGLAAQVPPEPARARGLVRRALAAQEAGNVAHARTLLEQAVKLDPTSKVAYNSLGNIYHQQQRYQQAVMMYERALALDPDYMKARTNLGSTYMEMDMAGRAIAELQRAIQADGTYGLAYYNLACVYARSGDSATAAQYLQQAVALEPEARNWARTDTDFAPVRATLEMQQLLRAP